MEQYKELIGKHITYISVIKKGGYLTTATNAVDGIIERVECSDDNSIIYFIVNGRYAAGCVKAELDAALECKCEFDNQFFYKLFAIYDKPTKE